MVTGERDGSLGRAAGLLGTLLTSGLFRLVALGVVIAFGVLAVSNQWSGVRDSLNELEPTALMASAAAGLGALGCALLVWRTLLADLGSRLTLLAAIRVFFVAQLTKYVPGSVWPVLAQMELGRDAGVPRPRSAAAFVLALLVANASGLFVACVTLPLLASVAAERFRWLLLAAPVFLAVAHPGVLNPLLGVALRVTRREPMTTALSWRGTLTAYTWSLVGWVAAGLHVWFVTLAFAGTGRGGFLLAVGGFALAWCAGFWAFVFPAGVGIRDLALAAALTPVLGEAAALAAALVSRLLLTLVDLLAGGFGFIATLRRRHLAAS